MNACHLFRDLIDEYLDGTIRDSRRQELRPMPGRAGTVPSSCGPAA